MTHMLRSARIAEETIFAFVRDFPPRPEEQRGRRKQKKVCEER